ncbi:hypothetical protein F4860DRAFT_524233 [Xylaria cubensis]|nr:hypothetical protein F4860DRAFT_524233 [Xylaria cubensis]
MFNHSSQKRTFEDEAGTFGDEDSGLNTKKPCLPTNTSRLPEIPSLDICSSLQVPQASASDKICFGMLRDILISFNYGQDTYSIILDKLGEDDNGFITLQLRCSDDRCDILANNVPFASMGTRIYFALKSLLSADLLSYNGVMPRSELYQELATAAQAPRTHSSKICCKMALIIFGPRSMKDVVAKGLARYRLFLQHPVNMPEGIIYENPQYLSIVASSFRNGAILPPIPAEFFNQGSSRTSVSESDESTTIEAVLDNLPRHGSLGGVEIDKRIRTMLLDHQKEAVDFLSCRESTEKQTNILWKLESLGSERPMYRHVITGLTSPKPHDTLGGILGDGMGLGKTLSMIACIVYSLAYAGEFASSLTKDPQRTLFPVPVASTLVIVPSVLLLDTWVNEIERHVVPGTLSVYRYHGPNRKLPSSPPLPYNIVLSTYGTVAADHSRGGGVLSYFHWYRLILDEAHVIRNFSTKQFKAVKDLSALVRWCVTGTPVQNSLKDLASLVTFLRVPLLDDAAMFRKHIEGRRETVNGAPKTNYRNLRCLLESLCLRRCTLTILSSLGVSFIQHRPCLSDGERKGYNELSSFCDRCIKAAVNGRSSGAQNKLILIAVLKLRMFCNTGLNTPMESLLNDTEDESDFKPDELISLLQQCGETLCTNCQTEVSSPGTDAYLEGQQHSAGHRIKCRECARSLLNTQETEKPSEYFDRNQSLTSSGMVPGAQFENDHLSASASDTLHHTSYPSKILSLVDDIKIYYHHDKSIVFSFWRRSLDLIEKIFIEQDITFVRVDGTIHYSKRSEVLATFQENPSIRVLLMTIGTGALGLNNLSVACRVHILEPQWNPSIEEQAIGRVARLGQSKRVTVIRYIVENTIEESIESRQLQKLQLALKSGLKSSNRDVSGGERRIEQLRTLGKIIESTMCAPKSNT